MNIPGFKKIKEVFKGRGYRIGQRPGLDWVLALTFFILLTFFGLFLTITNHPGESLVDESENASTQALPQTIINQIQAFYKVKEDTFKSLLQNPSNLADPSL